MPQARRERYVLFEPLYARELWEQTESAERVSSSPYWFVTAADGSTITSPPVGHALHEAGIFSVLQYNGTYRITSGDGRFVGVAGGGSLTATFGSTHFIKIDGTIIGI